MNGVGYSPSYGRMFPFLPAASHSENDLIDLAKFHMLDDPTNLPRNPPTMPLSGFVYFAQFALHDLTFDRTPLAIAGRVSVEDRVNYRSPFLDLDSLYGAGPEVSPHLYYLPASKPGGALLPPGNDRFVIDKTPGGQLLDLPRTGAGRPVLGDPRNEENLVLAQLHALMLRFHNRVMDLIDSGVATEPRLAGLSKFEQARQLVVWHYQYVFLYDLLNQVLDVTILNEALAGYRRFTSCPWDIFIPIEFALAAFRFGHSLVRNNYIINTISHPRVGLDTLLNLNSMGNPPMVRLEDEWVIEWGRFFNLLPPGNRNMAHGLDTHIALALHNLPGPIPIDPGSHPRMLQSLPAMTLLRGARSGLPSGQRVADALGEPRLSDAEMVQQDPADPDLADFLLGRNLLNDTPLWYYILQEAAARGGRQKLGRVGSRIVAETVVSLLAADPNSLLNRGAGWTPPAWDWATPATPIDDVKTLVRFALT
jgi:hypothetical protein